MKSMTDKSLLSTVFASGALALLSGSASMSYAADSVTDAIKEGKASLMLRLRYESVDQSASSGSSEDLDEDALTLKTRLNYKTGEFKGVSAFVEFDDVTEVDEVDYNTAPNDTPFPEAPIIADPEGSEINQAYLAFSGIPDTVVKWGRQRITLDNHRHVGHVAWRQNEQTYEGLTITNKSLPDTTIFLASIGAVKRIFGESSGIGEFNVSDVWLNIKYSGLPIGAITAYYYDIENETVFTAGPQFGRSSQTVGVRFSGSTDVGDEIKALYTLEFASQSDANNNPASYDADYYNIEGGIVVSGVTIKVGQEVLGADDTDGFFQTNYATLHKFQGWTDKFLSAGRGNITGGIEDTYISVGGKAAGLKLLLVYHDFSADDSDAAGKDDYGSEVGFLVAKKINNYTLALKYADYSADDHLTDTSKLWLTAQANF